MTWSTSEVAVCCSSASVRSVGALTQFVEQPRVLDGDDGLGSEVLDQRDLLISERTNFLAVNDERPISLFSFSIGTPRQCPYPSNSTAATILRIAFSV